MTVLNGFRVLQVGPGLAAAVCGRLLADVGATVTRIGGDRSTMLGEYLNRGDPRQDGTHDPAGAGERVGAGEQTRAKHLGTEDQGAEDLGGAQDQAGPEEDAWASADLIVCEGSPAVLRRSGRDVEAVRRRNKRAALVLIAPFGQTGPRAEEPATDLTLFFASGIARMLTGQVDDLDEPPLCPIGAQSAFIGGLAAACAGMHAALLGNGAVVDVSIQEALATLAMTELARAGQNGTSWSRRRLTDGNGATVCILPASDGFAAISPREDRQWASWLGAMGSPSWGGEARFATRQDRVANWDALHALMSAWSRCRTRQWIAETAQAAHVPSFPLCEPAEHLGSAQLRHRAFFRSAVVAGQAMRVPGSPFGLHLTSAERSPAPPASGALPLSGVRVLDFSWVIAGPTATRYLAAMGAEVIKVEAPGRGDPGRASELHNVLGQSKRGIVLDLKRPEAIAVAKSLAAGSDVLVENFATGVMDRLGLGVDALRTVNPDLIYVSASGLGRTGPDAHQVAYGTLLQCYAGFAGLNRHPGRPPRVGMAWLDPMCGLLLAFIVAASVWRRRSGAGVEHRSGAGVGHRPGAVARVDFSMIEAMLWTMAEPLLSEQLGAAGQARERLSVYRCAGPDDWLSAEPAPEVPPPGRGAAAEAAADGAADGAAEAAALVRSGIAAAALARSADLVADEHLRVRGFWNRHGAGVLPGLPWRASFGQVSGPAPELGADTDAVLREVLGMSADEIAQLRTAGALG
jgi:crotonobetainyl-CoA:carnitine CoA-transferase CaiB-like acyl-CoA transferase